jgi:hypothetical protein
MFIEFVLPLLLAAGLVKIHKNTPFVGLGCI